MIEKIVNSIVKKHGNEDNKRHIYGLVCGATGILLNFLLFIFKFAVGFLSSSISVVADAFNNLTDSLSSLLSVIGFRLSSLKADKKHPFGHGRIEYISALLISVIIMYVGLTLFEKSVSKIIHKEPFIFSIYTVIVLVLSISVKLFMAYYNKKYGERIDSLVLKAAYKDSINDCIATGAVLLSVIFMYFTKIDTDGFVGIFVALYILKSGILALLETSGPLVGNAPDPELVKAIIDTVKENPETLGVHDLVIHDYGPEKRFVSLHMEVDGSKDIFMLHDNIDATENIIKKKFSCEAVIHMDPVDIKNEELTLIKKVLKNAAKEINSNISVHDIRMVPGKTHTNIIFDIGVPPELYDRKSYIENRLTEVIYGINKKYFPIITTETFYF